jgi:hypothetical protein
MLLLWIYLRNQRKTCMTRLTQNLSIFDAISSHFRCILVNSNRFMAYLNAQKFNDDSVFIAILILNFFGYVRFAGS